MVVKHGVFDAREWLPFPGNGDNNTDTVFGGIHFNTTTLNHWNYTYYSNRTLSNVSECWLVFEPYEPQLLRTNGSFVNATSCYNAILTPSAPAASPASPLPSSTASPSS